MARINRSKFPKKMECPYCGSNRMTKAVPMALRVWGATIGGMVVCIILAFFIGPYVIPTIFALFVWSLAMSLKFIIKGETQVNYLCPDCKQRIYRSTL